MRVIEAIIATAVLAIAIMAAMNLARAPNPMLSKTRTELSRYCYDFLLRLAESESFDKILFFNGTLRNGWEQLMRVTLNALLPAGSLYNMAVYNVTRAGDSVELEALNRDIITNAPSPSSFSSAKEVAAADVTYTSRRFWILVIHLEITRG
jgi:hypothetical protein